MINLFDWEGLKLTSPALYCVCVSVSADVCLRGHTQTFLPAGSAALQPA